MSETPITNPISRDGTIRYVSAITVLTGVGLAVFEAFGQTSGGADTSQLILYLIGGGFGGQVAHRVAER